MSPAPPPTSTAAAAATPAKLSPTLQSPAAPVTPAIAPPATHPATLPPAAQPHLPHTMSKPASTPTATATATAPAPTVSAATDSAAVADADAKPTAPQPPPDKQPSAGTRLALDASNTPAAATTNASSAPTPAVAANAKPSPALHATAPATTSPSMPGPSIAQAAAEASAEAVAAKPGSEPVSGKEVPTGDAKTGGAKTGSAEASPTHTPAPPDAVMGSPPRKAVALLSADKGLLPAGEDVDMVPSDPMDAALADAEGDDPVRAFLTANPYTPAPFSLIEYAWDRIPLSIQQGLDSVEIVNLASGQVRDCASALNIRSHTILRVGVQRRILAAKLVQRQLSLRSAYDCSTLRDLRDPSIATAMHHRIRSLPATSVWRDPTLKIPLSQIPWFNGDIPAFDSNSAVIPRQPPLPFTDDAAAREHAEKVDAFRKKASGAAKVPPRELPKPRSNNNTPGRPRRTTRAPDLFIPDAQHANQRRESGPNITPPPPLPRSATASPPSSLTLEQEGNACATTSPPAGSAEAVAAAAAAKAAVAAAAAVTTSVGAMATPGRHGRPGRGRRATPTLTPSEIGRLLHVLTEPALAKTLSIVGVEPRNPTPWEREIAPRFNDPTFSPDLITDLPPSVRLDDVSSISPGDLYKARDPADLRIAFSLFRTELQDGLRIYYRNRKSPAEPFVNYVSAGPQFTYALVVINYYRALQAPLLAPVPGALPGNTGIAATGPGNGAADGEDADDKEGETNAVSMPPLGASPTIRKRRATVDLRGPPRRRRGGRVGRPTMRAVYGAGGAVGVPRMDVDDEVGGDETFDRCLHRVTKIAQAITSVNAAMELEREDGAVKKAFGSVMNKLRNALAAMDDVADLATEDATPNGTA